MSAAEMSKVWLITGTSGGIGLELVKCVLRTTKDRVAALTRTPASLEDLRREYAGRLEPIQCGLAAPAEIHAAVAAATGKWGRVDVLVNNAGYGLTGAVADLDEAELRDQFQINFFSAAQLIRETLPAMKERGSGYVVNISSVGGLVAWGGLGAYCASKFALEGLTEALNEEVRGSGIAVLLIEPGAVRTRWSGSSLLETKEKTHGGNLIAKVREILSANASKGLEPSAVAEIVVGAVARPPAGLRILAGADAAKWLRAKTDALRTLIDRG